MENVVLSLRHDDPIYLDWERKDMIRFGKKHIFDRDDGSHHHCVHQSIAIVGGGIFATGSQNRIQRNNNLEGSGRNPNILKPTIRKISLQWWINMPRKGIGMPECLQILFLY